MAPRYISSEGSVLAKRSPWRLSIVNDVIWGILGFFGLFWKTLFPTETTTYGVHQPRRAQRAPRGYGGEDGKGPRVRGMKDLKQNGGDCAGGGGG